MKRKLSLFLAISILITCLSPAFSVMADTYTTTEVTQKADATNRIHGEVRQITHETNYYGDEYSYYYCENIAYPYEIELSEDEFVRDGNAKMPSVIVYDYYYDVVDPANYVVNYYNNVDSGVATVTVDFIGDYYTGSLSTNFIIRAEAVKLSSVKYKSKGKIKVSWKKQSGVDGYVVQYSTAKGFTDNGKTDTVIVSGGTKTSKEIGGLTNKTYYVRVCSYKLIDGYKYKGAYSNGKSVKVKKGLSLKDRINYTKTDLSGRAEIKRLTNNGVDIKKYKTTYDRMKAIYTWHAKNNTKFAHCLACNSNFNECVLALYGKQRCYDNCVWIGAGYFINSNGSKAVHKWSVIYISGVPYIFDPRIQGYGNYKGFDYFGVQTASAKAKKRYQFDGWYFYQTSYLRYDLV